jgi:hypothetical protein
MRNGPTPQQRAIEKKRVRWRKSREKGEPFWATVDPETYDFESEGQHFDRLSDDEWAPIWKSIQAASPNKPVEESRLRELVDRAAFSSGWFVGHVGELVFYSANYAELADRNRAFQVKVQTSRHELIDFFGEVPADGYDAWMEHRQLLSALDGFAAQIQGDVAEYEAMAARTKSRP